MLGSLKGGVDVNDESIWQRWHEHYSKIGISSEDICRDGIIDYETYIRAKPKILFVMKEVNQWPGGDLREMLRNGPVYPMWHTVARWAAGILRGFPPFDEINKHEVFVESIRSIATINLKKISGQGYANMSIVNAFAFMDRHLLLDQIQMINPDIIVAGGTFDSLIWLLDLQVDPEDPWSRSVLDHRRNIKVIPWRHPGRVDNRETYDKLRDFFQTA